MCIRDRRVPAPLDQLPWEFAKDEFGSQQADFMGVMGALLVRTAKDEFRAYLVDPTRVPGTLPGWSRKTRSEMGHSEPAGDDATGVSPTRPALGTSARPPTAPTAAADLSLIHIFFEPLEGMILVAQVAIWGDCLIDHGNCHMVSPSPDG